MKRIVLLLLVISMSVLMFASCSSNTGSLLTEEQEKSILDRDYGIEIRNEAIGLKNYKSNNLGFSIAGSSKDNELTDYIYGRFKEIGLKNVQKVPVELDGWNLSDMSFRFDCDCVEAGYQDYHNFGVYPSDFDFDSRSFQVINVGSLIKNPDSYVMSKGVLIDSVENIKEEVELAYSKGAVFVVYCDTESGSGTYKVDLEKGISNKIPVFVFSKINYDALVKEVELGKEITVTIDGYSSLTENITSDFIIGEIEGSKKYEYIYISANRDSILEGFLSSKVPVGELLCLADTLVKEGYKPKYTIRFMVTTGQEFGDINGGKNVGIRSYLNSDKINKKNIKYSIVLDGSKPLLESLMTQYDISSKSTELKEKLEKLNKSIEGKSLGYITQIGEINSSYVTEALVWDEFGIPTIHQAEPITSFYYSIEDTSKDDASIKLESDYCTYLVYYMREILNLLN